MEYELTLKMSVTALLVGSEQAVGQQALSDSVEQEALDGREPPVRRRRRPHTWGLEREELCRWTR